MDSKQLPFTQGVEIELQIVDQSGSLLQGQSLIRVWDHLLKRAAATLEKRVLEGAPSIVRERLVRVGRVEKERQGRRLPYITVSYKMRGGKSVEIYAFGPDPNISQVTWILELVTPPCETMEELGWWIKSLYRVALDSLPGGYGIISIGFNPKEAEYRSGVTFGDHYHIGLPDSRDRLAAYNVLRCFLPHLIALSVNSPFMNEGPTGNVKVKKMPRVTILGQNNVRSLRLKFNKGQTGPADKDHYIPFLERLDRRQFDKVVSREPPDDRFVDMFPFTDYGTIEIRVFDSQFSVSRRLALVAIIQALAYKAVKLARSGQRLPDVSSEVLVDNRDKAIEFGLFGKFFGDDGLSGSNKQFAKYYNFNPETGKPNTKLFEAVQSMLKFIQGEVEELGFQEYLKPVLASVMGTSQLEPPCSPADYLLYLYHSSGGEFKRVTSNLIKMTEDFCTSLEEDPITRLFGAPELAIREAVATTVTTAQTVATGVTAPIAAPVSAFSVKGTASVGVKQVIAEERIPFQLSLSSNSSSEAHVTILGKVLSKEGDEEAVISTAVKEVSLKPSKESTFRENSIPLSVPFGAFSKPKSCFLQFTVRDDEKNELAKIKTGSFRVIATPNISIRPSSVYKKFEEGKTYEMSFHVANTTPQFSGKYQVRVFHRFPSGALKLQTEKSLTNLKEVKIPHSLKVGGEIAKEAHLRVRVQVLYKGRIVSEYETPNIEVIPKEVPAPEPKKPEVKVVTKLPTEAYPPQVAPRVKPEVTVKPTPRTAPQPTPPKTHPPPQVHPQPQKYRAERAEPTLKLKVVTPTLETAPPEKVRPKEKVKPAAPARASRKIKLKTGPAGKPTREKAIKPTLRVSGAKPTSAKQVSETKTSHVKVTPKATSSRPMAEGYGTRRAETVRMAEATPASVPTWPAAKRVRESKAVEVSAVEPPRVSLYVNSKDRELVLGSGCNFEIDLKNLNLEVTGDFWLNLYYCPIGGYEVLVGHKRVKLFDKKRVGYRFKMEGVPKAKRFKLRAEVIYNGLVVERSESAEIPVRSPVAKKMLGLRGVLNVPQNIMPGVRILPLLQVNAEYVLEPVNVSVNLEVSSQEASIQKEAYFYTIREDGTYFLPMPLRIRSIPSGVNKVSLEASLNVGGVNIGSKKASIPVTQQASVIEVIPPLIQGNLGAGENAKYLLRVKNNAEKSLTITVDFTFLPLNSKEIHIGSTRLKLNPGEQGQIEESFTPPLYTADGECFLIAKLSYSLEGKVEEWISSKLQVSRPQFTPLEVKIRGTPHIPSIVRSDDKVELEVVVKKKYVGEELKVQIYAIGEEAPEEIKSINVKQKEETKTYGPFSWRVPRVPYRTRYILEARATEKGQTVPSQLIKREKVEIVVLPREPD
ncbi:MAG: glutamate-cysteine ligase family protein [Candidatus Jordarchaeaceae archaeon]